MANTLCNDFQAAGVAAGIKKNGAPDLGLIVSRTPAAAAGVFTRNRVQAAPVVLDQQRLPSDNCRAIIVNSGNANCCNGPQGWSDAVAMARSAAVALGVSEEQVLVASTGVIGQPLPIDRIQAAVPELAAALQPQGFADFATAIMTTDTLPKLVFRQGRIGKTPFHVVATAKGSGMIRPDMATLLAFVCSDIEAGSEDLQGMLTAAVNQSFNQMTIDGDTSTNDTLLLLANGASGAQIKTTAHRRAFQAVLDDVLITLTRLLVKDGEGATKLIAVRVVGAASEKDARRVANTIAHSNLVKTAFFGQDANWGRIMAAAGRAGVALDAGRIDIAFDDVQMVTGGMGNGDAVEAAATQVLQKDEFSVTVDLNTGSATALVWTCDFSLDYVRINADYRS